METKEYLQQIERIDRRIQNKLAEIYQLKQMACSVSVANEGERVQTSIRNDRLAETVAKIIDKEKEANKMVDEYVDTKANIIRQIESLENTDYYHILFNRYIIRKKWEDIATDLNYSVRDVTRKHGKALQEFEKMWGNTYL